MTLAIATRGYVIPRVCAVRLTYLHPSAATLKQNSQLEMVVVFGGPVSGDQVVTLESDDTAVITVPASVTVLDGQQTASFYATSHAIGTATVTATYIDQSPTSDLEVVSIDDKLVPEITTAKNLKPAVTSAKNLRPRIYDTEES